MNEITSSGVFLTDLTLAFAFPERIPANLLVRRITGIVANSHELEGFRERARKFTLKESRDFFINIFIRLDALGRQLQLSPGLTDNVLNEFRLDLLGYKAFVDEFPARQDPFFDSIIPCLYQQAKEKPDDPSIAEIKRLVGIDLYDNMRQLIEKKVKLCYGIIPDKDRIGEAEKIQVGEILINELNKVAQSHFSNTNPLNAIERVWDTPDTIRFILNRTKQKSREKLGLRNKNKPPTVESFETLDENIKGLDISPYLGHGENEDFEHSLIESLQNAKEGGQKQIFGRFLLKIHKSPKLEDYLRNQTLNIEKLAKDAGVSRDTVKRFLHDLRAYYKNK